MPKDKDGYDFEVYAENMADMVSFMVRSKKFKAKYPDLAKRLRASLSASLESEGEGEEEPLPTGKRSVSAAQATFDKETKRVIADVKRKFGMPV
jgi:hypothetical protein